MQAIGPQCSLWPLCRFSARKPLLWTPPRCCRNSTIRSGRRVMAHRCRIRLLRKRVTDTFGSDLKRAYFSSMARDFYFSLLRTDLIPSRTTYRPCIHRPAANSGLACDLVEHMCGTAGISLTMEALRDCRPTPYLLLRAAMTIPCGRRQAPGCIDLTATIGTVSARSGTIL